MRSPLRRGLRLCRRFARDISRRRCSTRPPPCGFHLGALIDSYWCRCCCWRRCRGYLRRGLSPESKRLSHCRTAFGISRGGERMIAPQSPTLQVFIPAQAMSGADVPSQRLAPIATIEAHHVILMNGSPDRHSRSTNFLWLNGLSELTERLLH